MAKNVANILEENLETLFECCEKDEGFSRCKITDPEVSKRRQAAIKGHGECPELQFRSYFEVILKANETQKCSYFLSSEDIEVLATLETRLKTKNYINQS